jgi:hypothetical protein
MSSHGSPGGQTIHYEGTLAEQLESIDREWAELYAESDRKWAELNKRWAEHEQRVTAEFERTMEMIRQEMASDDAYYNEVVRRNSEDLRKKLRIVGKTCTVLNVVFPAAAVLTMIYANV